MERFAESYDMISVETVAELAGVDKATAEEWTQSDPSFPRPLATLPTGNLYDRRAVEKWLLENGYRGIPIPPAP